MKKKEFYNETPSRHKALGTGAGAGGACTEKKEQMLLYVCTLCVERLPCIRYLPHDGGAGMGKRKARDPSSIRGYRIEAMGVVLRRCSNRNRARTQLAAPALFRPAAQLRSPRRTAPSGPPLAKKAYRGTGRDWLCSGNSSH